jgi:hypothetical protein
MKERLVTLALALAALLCFYLLFFPKPSAQGEQTLPVSSESGVDGYLGAWRWLQAEHIPLASLRYRYDRLTAAELSVAGGGNVLITTLPQRLPYQLSEWQALERWIKDGNTLLVMAALDDTPQWSLGGSVDSRMTLQRISHLHFSAAADTATLKQWPAPQPVGFVAQGQHPLLQGVHAVQAISELPASQWRAHSTDQSLPLAIARKLGSTQSVMWLKTQGHGQIIVCAFATPFSNRELDQADNALLLSNIIAWSRRERGRVIFDDAHQGLVDFYDAARFFGDPRLHRTLWWIVLLWLLFVLGPQRMRRTADGWHAVDETALIEASGRFFSVAVDAADARRELFSNFFNVLRRRLGLPDNGEPVWEWLDERAPLSAQQRRELHALYARVCAGERMNLKRLHNYLTTVQGHLT